MQRASRSDAQLFGNCVITVHTASGAITRLWLLNATGLMHLWRGEGGRNNNDTKHSSVSINMFAGTKVKTIGAPTMWYFTNVLGSKLAYNSDNHESSGSNRTLHTQHGKVLDCAKQHFKLFSTHGKTTFLLHNKKGQFCFRKYWPLTKNKVFRDKTLCAVAKIYWRLEETESPPQPSA